jgi:RND superfamily putative drug exporter
MLPRIALFAIGAPRRILLVTLMFLVSAGILSASVMDTLSAAGFRDEVSESWEVSQVLANTFDAGDLPMVVTVTSDAGAQSAGARTVGTDLVHQLDGYGFVAGVQSAWTAPPSVARTLVSDDGKTGLIVAGIKGGESGAQKNARELLPLIHDRDGVTVKAGGSAVSYIENTDQAKRDMLIMEAIALPVSFVVLVWIFGGLLAAAIPLAVGVISIVGSMALMRIVAEMTDISIFALNLILAMGLALAFDYSLLIVSRFRDELADGWDRNEALKRTMTTAGRTVLFSALTVAPAMVVMLVFPMYFLKSFAYAGVAVVALAAAASLLVTPALLVLFGNRLDSYDIRKAVRRLFRLPPKLHRADRAVTDLFWYRWTKGVLRHPFLIGSATMAVVLLLGAPFLGVKWGYPDDRVLPADVSTSRQVGDQLREGFSSNAQNTVDIVLRGNSAELTPDSLDAYAAHLSKISDVTAVSAPDGTFVGGGRVGPPSAPTGIRDGHALVTVTSAAPLYSEASETQLDRLHAVEPPAGTEVLVGGVAQIHRDSTGAIAELIPTVLLVIAIITFVLLFLLTGSIVIPVKAIILNVLSLCASFGALVWIFQEGHLGGLGSTAVGTLLVNVPVLLFCLTFGLSMDYEVFLVSRIREFWLASGRTAADNDEAVALGIARTGRVVTAAALLMAVCFFSLTFANVSVVQTFGLGITLAVLADATLVRMLLVPTFMHFLGTWNWWAPEPLRRLHERFGLSESGLEPAARKPQLQPGDEPEQLPIPVAPIAPVQVAPIT